MIVIISLYLGRNTFRCFHLKRYFLIWSGLFSVVCCRGSKQKEESVCVPLSHHDALRISVNYCSKALQTHLDMILLMTFFTQGASGSRQTSCPDFFRVALQHQEEQICSWLDESLKKFWKEIWNQILVLHDLCLFTVGVGGNQLHLANVAADGPTLCLDAAAVLFHSEAPQAHSYWEAAATHAYKMQLFEQKLKCMQGRAVRYVKIQNLPLLISRNARSTTRDVRKTLLHMTEERTIKEAEGFLFWKFSNEAKTSEQVYFWFLGLLAFPSLAQRCCLNQVLKRQAFIAVLEMSHFPRWGVLRKMGFLLVKREFTVR